MSTERITGVRITVTRAVENQRKYVCKSDLMIVTSKVIPEDLQDLAIPRSRWLKVIWELHKNRDTSIAVMHGVFIPHIIIICMLLWILRVRYVIVAHGTLSEDAVNLAGRPEIKRLWVRFLVKPVSRAAYAIQYLNEEERSRTILPASTRSIIVPNSVELPDAGPMPDTEHGSLRLSFIGRLHIEQKGLDLLVDALARVRDDLAQHKVSLRIYGPGEGASADALRDLIQAANLADVIELAGPVFGDEKEDALRNTDVFVHTSRFEGEPTAVLEAMSYALPVLVTRGTNMLEIVEHQDAGWVADNNTESIVTALRASFTEDVASRRARGARGRVWIEANRSPEVVAAAQAASYFGR